MPRATSERWRPWTSSGCGRCRSAGRLYSMDAPALTTAPAGEDAQPLERPTLFVGGNSRSGTTMLGEILGMHAQAFMLTELHFWEKLWTPEQAGETLDADE